MATRTIAFLTPLYFDETSCLGGGERHPHNLARGVVRAGDGRYRVVLLSFGSHAFERVLEPGVTLRVLQAARPRHPLDVVSWELPAALQAERVSLLHLHQAFTRCSEMGLLVGKLAGLPVCVTDHGGDSSRIGRELGLLDLADCVVPVSDFSASNLPTEKPVVVVKGGVDASVFTPSEQRIERDRVLFVGRLLPHKGVDRLIEATPSHLRLTICGRPSPGPYLDRLHALAAGRNVEFVTDADDDGIRHLYRRAWATVLPSVERDCYGQSYGQAELMGFTLLESMACGTPALCRRVGGMPEFVDHGQTGFVFDSEPELHTLLERLASDPDEVERLGDQGRRHVLEHFDLAVAGRRLVAVYDGVLAGGGRSIASQGCWGIAAA
jgi:glycosyltransferase involved in cell wall biosynthesis